MKTDKNYSATMRCSGGTVTLPFSSWLAKCERHDDWHELSAKEKTPTLANVARFLRNDYNDFELVGRDAK
jgi:thiol-disulfide isomerase/thioredoxin